MDRVGAKFRCNHAGIIYEMIVTHTLGLCPEVATSAQAPLDHGRSCPAKPLERSCRHHPGCKRFRSFIIPHEGLGLAFAVARGLELGELKFAYSRKPEFVTRWTDIEGAERLSNELILR
jgi:hypothetical protein